MPDVEPEVWKIMMTRSGSVGICTRGSGGRLAKSRNPIFPEANKTGIELPAKAGLESEVTISATAPERSRSSNTTVALGILEEMCCGT